MTAFNALWLEHYTVLISLWLQIYHPLTVHELKCPNSLCPGEMFLISSVQQDRRAPADRFLRTPIFPPLEGALTPPSSRVSTSSLDNSCWMVKLSSMASTPTEHTLANEEAAELRSVHFTLSRWLYSLNCLFKC